MDPELPPGLGAVLGRLKGAGEWLGMNTLGRALALGTMDPRAPQTQDAYDATLGVAADFMPGTGDVKALAYDAPALFAEGHPVWGAVTAASGVPVVGAPFDLARKFGPALRAADDIPAPRNRSARQEATSRASRTSPANIRARTAEVLAGLMPDEAAQFTRSNKGVTTRVLNNYARLPTPEDFAQVAIRGSGQRGWYKASADAIHETFGDDAGRFAALMAAQSPNKSVAENVRYATETWANWVAAGRPTDPSILRNKIITAPLEADMGNSIRTLTAAQDVVQKGQFDFLSGPKVNPFGRNLFGEVNPVVNDTWMARAFGTHKSGVGSPSRMLAQNALTRNAAKVFEGLTGTAVDPREMQEMVWSVVRGTQEIDRKSSAGDIFEAALRDPDKMRALDASIGDSDPIGVLLSHPDYVENLRRAGLRPPAPRSLHGTPGVDPHSADVNALRDIYQRMIAAKSRDTMFYTGAGLGMLGVKSANARFQEEQQRRPNSFR